MNDSGNNYRLHHTPFLLIWAGLIGVAWLSLFTGGILITFVRNEVPFMREMASWIYLNARWIDGLQIGIFFGAILALVQAWLIRWRYGFVPRFWRIATFLGATLSAALFSDIIYSGGYYDANGSWVYPSYYPALALWFCTLSLVQMLALWPVVRRAWLYALSGIGALGFGCLISYLESSANYSYNPMSVLFFGSIAQAIFTGALFLWLMRDYRVEAVPKRDEKAKLRQGMGLHPISFIGLWLMDYLFGWVSLLSIGFIAYTISNFFYPLRDFLNVVMSIQWLAAGIMGLLTGGAIALFQPWIMKQRSNYHPRFWLWIALSAVGWAIAGQAIPYLGSSYTIEQMGMLKFFGTLLLWFALPTILHSLAFWREKRGFWIYALAGVVSAAMAYFVYQQLAWTNTGILFAMVFGSGLQAILTGAAFMTMMAQNQQAEATALEVVPISE